MKKVTGCGLRVAGCRLQVAGCRLSGCRVITLGVILFASNLLSPVYGQQLKYSFRQGDILDYDYVMQRPAQRTNAIDPFKTTWKYRFTVDSVGHELFWISMKVIGVYSSNYWITGYGNTAEKNIQYPGIVNQLNKVYDIEINNPVRFSMDPSGRINQIDGEEKLMAGLLELAVREPSLKQLNFNTFKVRYSETFLSLLIHEFFPEVSGQTEDTICLSSGKRNTLRINSWPLGNSQINDPGEHRIYRRYEFLKDNHIYNPMDQLSQNDDMVVNWDPGAGFPSRISYEGFAADYLLAEIVLKNGNMDMPKYAISITMTSANQPKEKRVLIAGQIQRSGDDRIVALLPGNTISNEQLMVTLDSTGGFRLDFELDLPAGIIDIFYHKPGSFLWVSPDNPDLIRIFVRPGDSVFFKIDLGDPKSLQFECLTSPDQQFLNSLSRDCPPSDPEQSIRTTLQNMQLLDENKSGLNPEFIRFMEFENRYKLLSHQVELFSRSGTSLKIKNPLDSLPRFIRELNNPDGYQSDAYKEFICDLVQSYRITQVMKLFNYSEERNVDLTTAMLNGWDLYWYQAMRAEQNLSHFPSRTYDILYQRFAEQYPGTEFLNQLTARYRLTEKVRIGSLIPEIKFKDIKGRNHSTSDFTDDVWGIFVNPTIRELSEFAKRWMGPIQRDHPEIKTFIALIPEGDQAEIDSLLSDCEGKPILLIDKSQQNKTIIDFLTIPSYLPASLIFMDRGNRIAEYSQFRTTYWLNFLTWPLVNTTSPKTLSLKTFWYSLIGAFVLSLSIVFMIRMRARRREARLTLKRKMAQLEVDAVRSRMNPHFLFNALSSIQNLINRKQIEEANLFLARFGDLVRTILSQSSKPAIGLNEEIDMIRNYLQLEQLRFPFQFDIRIDPGLDTFAIEVPPLLIQPHVENAVMHGISALGREGRIDISFSAENLHLICKVKDNGPGYHPGTKTGSGGLGQGWNLTRQRIRLMKEQYGDEVSVEVQSPPIESGDHKETSGTTVIFRLPIQKTNL